MLMVRQTGLKGFLWTFVWYLKISFLGCRIDVAHKNLTKKLTSQGISNDSHVTAIWGAQSHPHSVCQGMFWGVLLEKYGLTSDYIHGCFISNLPKLVIILLTSADFWLSLAFGEEEELAASSPAPSCSEEGCKRANGEENENNNDVIDLCCQM